MAPAVLAVRQPGDHAGWLLVELKHRVTIVDCRGRDPDGLLVAPFICPEDLAETLDQLYPDWANYLEIVMPGKARVESLLAG